MNNPFRKKKIRNQRSTLVSASTLQLIPTFDDGSELPILTTEGRISRGWIHYEGQYPGEVEQSGHLSVLRLRWHGLECKVGLNSDIRKGDTLTIVGDISVSLHGALGSDESCREWKPNTVIIYRR